MSSSYAQFLATVPAARLRPYQTFATSNGVDVGDLYRWNNQLSLALFDDIGVVEVAMRSAMAKQLAHEFGHDWYRNPALFDDDTVKLISSAWNQGRLGSLSAPSDVVQGKLVASFMFGFWVKLLGKGSHRGRKDPYAAAPLQTRRVYDDLIWKPALSKAFPNVGRLERRRVERTARDIQTVRNRIAHHEHVIWGIPVYGQKDASGNIRRMTVSESHSSIISMADYLDADLGSWLRANSAVPACISACPSTNQMGLLL